MTELPKKELASFIMQKRPLTWLITGCSAGLGLTLTRIVQSHGHRVIATSRNPSRTPALVSEITSKSGRWEQLDLNDPSCGAVIDRLEAEGEHIDVLVNNAGAGIFAVLESAAEADVRKQMDTLYFGPYRLMRAMVPHMRRRRFGVIANFSSAASLGGFESMGLYSAGKAALDALSKTFCKEVSPFNIRILTVGLGGFNTGMGDATVLGEGGIPPEYADSTAANFIEVIRKGEWTPPGDKEKGMQAIYEIITCTGRGAGHENEPVTMLGAEYKIRAEETIAAMSHQLDVFGELATSVATDSK